MAVDTVPPVAPEGGPMSTLRGVPSFWQSVRAEMAKVTWPERPDVMRATIAIIIFVLLLGLLIYVLDAVLSLLLVKLIPTLFAGR